MPVVGWVHHVEWLGRHIHERQLQWIGCWAERVALRELLDDVHARIRVPVDQKAAPDDYVVAGLCPRT